MIEDTIRDESPAWVNAAIDRETLLAIERFRDASPERIHRRLDDLGHELDVTGATMLAGSAASLAGLAMARVHRGWLAVPAALGALMLLAALPIPSPLTRLFRVMGFRSRTEIERERHALKMLRGDYRRVEEDPTAKGALTSAQAEIGISGGSGFARVTEEARAPVGSEPGFPGA